MYKYVYFLLLKIFLFGFGLLTLSAVIVPSTNHGAPGTADFTCVGELGEIDPPVKPPSAHPVVGVTVAGVSGTVAPQRSNPPPIVPPVDQPVDTSVLQPV